MKTGDISERTLWSRVENFLQGQSRGELFISAFGHGCEESLRSRVAVGSRVWNLPVCRCAVNKPIENASISLAFLALLVLKTIVLLEWCKSR